jgi:hypothetical protein
MDLRKGGKKENGMEKFFTLSMEAVRVDEMSAMKPILHTGVTPNA